MGVVDFIRRLFGGDTADEQRDRSTGNSEPSPPETESVGEQTPDEGDTGIDGLAESLDRIATAGEDSGDPAAELRAAMNDVNTAADQVRAAEDGDDDTAPPQSFREDAEELAEFWAEHDLDFSPESLVRLDAFVDNQWEKDRFHGLDERAEDGVHMDQLVFHGVVEQLGSYFGETLVRTYDGAEWIEDENFGWAVEVEDDEESLLSNVFHVAKDCLREPSKFAITHDNILSYVDLDGEPLDPDSEHVTIAVSVPDADATPAEFRAAAEQFVDDYAWVDLDYTPESLPVLDRLVQDELFDGEQLVDAFSDAELSETVRKLGSYLGVTIEESLDGEWTHEDETWTVEVSQNGQVVGVDVFQAALSTLHEDVSVAGIYAQLTDAVIAEDGEPATLEELFETEAEEFATEHPTYDLDLSRDSLERLDQLAAAEYPEFTELEEATDELVEAATPFGAYFGEVLRAEYDAIWQDDDGYAIFVEAEDGEHVGVDAIQTAAACLTGNASFAETCENILGLR